MSDSKYCYPDTDVLINHFNIKDSGTLDKVERDLTSVNIALLIDSPVKGNFNLKHLQDIHYAVFHDIYPFAGKIRTVSIAKTNLFCLPQYIHAMADEIFGKLHKDNFIRGLDKDSFIDKLAYYSGEINALHPFREGNGRTQRLFLQELSKAAGYQLLFAAIDKQILLQADIEAMKGNYEPLKKLYHSGIKHIQHKEIPDQDSPSVLERIKADRAKQRSEPKTVPQKGVKKKSDRER